MSKRVILMPSGKIWGTLYHTEKCSTIVNAQSTKEVDDELVTLMGLYGGCRLCASFATRKTAEKIAKEFTTKTIGKLYGMTEDDIEHFATNLIQEFKDNNFIVDLSSR